MPIFPPHTDGGRRQLRKGSVEIHPILLTVGLTIPEPSTNAPSQGLKESRWSPGLHLIPNAPRPKSARKGEQVFWPDNDHQVFYAVEIKSSS